jgi:hypothetical protein
VYAGEEWQTAADARYPNWKMAALARTLDKLHKHGIAVSVLVDVPTTSIDPPRMLAMQEYAGIEKKFALPAASYRDALENGIYAFRRLYGDHNIAFIDPGTLLCDTQTCRTEVDGRSLYHDKTHLSVFGARYVSQIIDLGQPAPSTSTPRPLMITTDTAL